MTSSANYCPPPHPHPPALLPCQLFLWCAACSSTQAMTGYFELHCRLELCYTASSFRSANYCDRPATLGDTTPCLFVRFKQAVCAAIACRKRKNMIKFDWMSAWVCLSLHSNGLGMRSLCKSISDLVFPKFTDPNSNDQNLHTTSNSLKFISF